VVDIAVLISGRDRDDGESGRPSGRARHGSGRGGPGSRRRRGRRGRRARRGDARIAILLLLEEEPRNGYGLMQEIEERSGGVWRPSPGSIYPALSQLEDEGLIEPTGQQRKAFSLTAEGRTYVEENRETMGAPWDTVAEGASDELGRLRDSSQALAAAAVQVARTGGPEQLRRARQVMDSARRDLYRILAGENAGPGKEEGD
jgi:DNA-binding PadR family transcriptional regulator